MVDDQAKAIADLKPCWFCGSDMSSFAGMTPGAFCRSDTEFAVGCDCRDCSATGPLKPSMEEAVEAWNTRAVSISRAVPPDGSIEALISGITDDPFQPMFRDEVIGLIRGAVSISRASQGSGIETDTFVRLEQMRQEGWSVAVHNDYRLVGKPHTFWLFTHDNGRWVKGEGQSDLIALSQVIDAIAALSPPATPQAPEDVRARAVAAIDDARAYAFGFPSSESVVGALDRAHLLATPVTVTAIELDQIHDYLTDPLLPLRAPSEAVAEALRRVLGGRIQISGQIEGPK